jgi:hypothetical protein
MSHIANAASADSTPPIADSNFTASCGLPTEAQIACTAPGPSAAPRHTTQ